jgi:hypothetical protein
MTGMIGHAALLLNQVRHPARRPQAGLIAQRFRTTLQTLHYALAIRFAETWFSTRPARLLQAGSPFLSEFRGPLANRLTVCAHPPGHFRLRHALLQQPGSVHSPPFQCCKVSANPCWESHAPTLA